ncbi:MAG TPA: hydrogenase assembly protein HupF [Elusimicrobia bacterium]|nr:hydrogenase assembly protein HupF [Elusimicrobiota bacterium]HBT62619.1 hydrogenase assembly protein HupF [Elusimicrobiota bacterium]
MCLGIPGRIVAIFKDDTGLAQGRLDFGGIFKPACLAYVPEAKIGDYVIVHAGFAISMVDPEEAAQVFKYLEELDQAVAREPQ